MPAVLGTKGYLLSQNDVTERTLDITFISTQGRSSPTVQHQCDPYQPYTLQTFRPLARTIQTLRPLARTMPSCEEARADPRGNKVGT